MLWTASAFLNRKQLVPLFVASTEAGRPDGQQWRHCRWVHRRHLGVWYIISLIHVVVWISHFVWENHHVLLPLPDHCRLMIVTYIKFSLSRILIINTKTDWALYNISSSRLVWSAQFGSHCYLFSWLNISSVGVAFGQYWFIQVFV